MTRVYVPSPMYLRNSAQCFAWALNLLWAMRRACVRNDALLRSMFVYWLGRSFWALKMALRFPVPLGK